MLTIKELEDRTRQIQAKIDAENQVAEQEHGKADEYRSNEDFDQAKAHDDTAMEHEQKAILLQDQLATINKDQQRLQAEIAELDRKRTELQISKDQELMQLDNQIDRIRGGA